MKRFANPFTTVLLCLAVVSSASAAVNIVGYYNATFHPGDNLIANQLTHSDSPGHYSNTLDEILRNGTAAGSTLTKWDPVGNSYLPKSVFDGTSWSINYTLELGDGALLFSPVRATNTFVGTVFPGWDPNSGNPPDWHPNYANGLYLISDPLPIARPMDQLFPEAIGRNPRDGEWVRILDAASQTYTLTTFHIGTGAWDNGDPILGVGQSAWFNLGPVVVPEPSTAALAFLGVGTLVFARRRK